MPAKKKTSFKKKLGARIAELRSIAGFSQEQLAEKLGLAVQSISAIETGMNFPKAENIEAIAETLGVETEDIFRFKDINNRDELLKELHQKIDFIKNDNARLLVLYDFIQKLV